MVGAALLKGSRTALKLCGTVGEKKIMVLVECEAFHNYISRWAISTISYWVKGGDSHKVKTSGECSCKIRSQLVPNNR